MFQTNPTRARQLRHIILLNVVAVTFVVIGSASFAGGTCATLLDGSGDATVYGSPDPLGTPCLSPYIFPEEYGVAVGNPFWGDSAACGRCVEISGAAETVIAQVIDLCPECLPDRLDLTSTTWNAVTGTFPSIQPITWHEVPCPITDPVNVQFRPGSSEFFFQAVIQNHRNGIAQVRILTEPAQPILPRTSFNAFQYSLGTALTLPMTLEITDIHGEIVTATVNSFSGLGEVAGSGQFPVCIAAGAPGEPSALTVLQYNRALGTLDLSFTPGCDSSDHTVVSGPLASVSTLAYSDQICGLGVTGTATYQAGSGSEFFLVVGNNGVEESSYGRNSSGAERIEDLTDPSCSLTQSLGATCAP